MDNRFSLLGGVLLLVSLAAVHTQPPPEYNEAGFFRYGVENRDRRLTKGNDISSPAIILRWGMPFFNKKYWSIFVNDNGVLSFINAYNDHSEQQDTFPVGTDPEVPPEGVIPLQRILIAPFFANVDTTNSGQIFYRQSTEKDLMERCDRAVHQFFLYHQDFRTKFMIIATWDGVSFYGYSGGSAPVNTFQVVIATDEFETFAFFRYRSIQWTTGVESGGSSSTGNGGNAAIMGFNAGDDDNYYIESLYSGRSEELKKLPQNTNNGEAGMFVYQISRISVQYPVCREGDVRTYPRFDSMLGHSWLTVAGPCFDRTREHWILFGDVDEPKAIQNCTYHTRWMVYCFTPTFFEVDRQMPIHFSTNDGIDWAYHGVFGVVRIGDTPQRVTRVNPDSEAWLRADRPVTIEWDPRLINFTQVRIDVLAYSEAIDPDTGLPGPPTWEEIDEVSYTVPNTGRYTWTSRAVYQVNDRNCIGVIRVTRRYKRDDLALWSDLHFLGYIMNDKFQNDPATYSNLRCDEFYKREEAFTEDMVASLRPCPCNLTQALADRGRFKSDPACNMDDAVQDRTQEYCRFRDDIVHCVASIVPSATGHDSTCCYDEWENLVYAGDSSSGSFSRRVTVEGIPPYNEAGKVPQLSSGIADLAPYYMCCIWGDHCDYYQEVRPTRDCRWYRTVRPATVYGDPHFATFDGVEYTFNAKGEYTLLDTTADSQTQFKLQGRFQDIQDRNGVQRKATVLTAVGMQQDNKEKLMIRKSDRTVLEVYIDTELLEIDDQTTIRDEFFFLTFPQKKEKGNLTQVIVTYIDSEIAVVINGTEQMMTAQVLLPYRFRQWVTGLFGSWDDDPENDLRSRSGALFDPDDPPESLYTGFGQSWEIESAESLFHYDELPGHDRYQDDSWVPDFTPPTDVELPQPEDLVRICQGNQFCEYDLQTTGNIELAKATMLAYEQYWLAFGASFDLITCNYLKTPKNGTKTFLRNRNHKVGSEIEFACEDNFILIGSPYKVCEPPQVNQGEFRQGQWSGNGIVNDCIESPICGGLPTPKHGSIEVSGPPENMKVAYTCDENYDLYGRTERFCDTERETWIYIEPYCYHKLNPIEIAGAVIGGIAGLVILIVFVALCCLLQYRSRQRKAQFPGNKRTMKQKRSAQHKVDMPDTRGVHEPSYTVRDTPIEVQRSYPSSAAAEPEPTEDPYAKQMRQQLQARPQYSNVPQYSKPSPHSSQTLPYPEKGPIPGQGGMRQPPEMRSPAEPRYGYTDPDNDFPPPPTPEAHGEEIELELRPGKSLESWA